MSSLATQWLWPTAISVFLLWGLGWPVAYTLAPASESRLVALMAPVFGFAVLCAACHDLGSLGLSVDQYAWMFPALAAAGLAAIRRSGSFRQSPRWPIGAVCVVAYLVAMTPLLDLRCLTVTGETIDGISYAVRAEYLREAAPVVPSVPAGRPFYAWVASHIALLRLGDVYFVAVVGALSGARSYLLLTTTAALFFALTPASLYCFARSGLGIESKSALVAAGLAGIHNLLLWPVHDDFLSQSVAIGIFPLLLSFACMASRSCEWPATLAYALLAVTLLAVYPAYAVAAGLIGLWIAFTATLAEVRAATSPLSSVLRRRFGWALGLIGMGLVCNGVAIERAFTELRFLTQLLSPQTAAAVGRGNILVFPSVFELAGLGAHASLAYGLWAPQLPTPLLAVLTFLVAVAAVLGWRRLASQARAIASGLVIVIGGLALQQRFLVGYPYGYFKMTSLLVLVLLPLFAEGVSALLATARLRHVGAALLASVVVLNAVNTVWTVRFVARYRTPVTRQVKEVEAGLDAVPHDEWVLLDLEPGVRQHWIGYLLKGHRIHYREPLFTWRAGSDPETLPSFRYALVERSLDPRRRLERSGRPWYDPTAYRVIWANDVYELRRRRDDGSG